MSDGQEIETESAEFITGIPVVKNLSPIFVDKECEDHHHPLLALVVSTDEGVTTLVFDLDTNAGAALLDGRMADAVKQQAIMLGFEWQNEVDSD